MTSSPLWTVTGKWTPMICFHFAASSWLNKLT